MTDYIVRLDNPGPYRIGVDYEIPSKSIQYNNLILDNINSQFTGVAKTFSLSSDSQAYYPINNQQLIVSKNNLLLEPSEDYTISTNNIIFDVAPNPGDDVFIIALATTADLTRTINYVIDSGTFPMDVGNKGSLTIDVTGTLESVTILSDQIGTLGLNIRKTNYSNYPNHTSIIGTGYVQMYNDNKYRDETLLDWDKSINAGDILNFEVINVTNITRFLVSLKLKL